MTIAAPARSATAARAMVAPLALAQFVASYAATNMNVAISTIAKDIGTTVFGIQTAITLFTLTMAALMIPGSKLTDLFGRKRCFVVGMVVYGIGALLAAFAQGLTVIVIGYSLLEGVGSALMIPPIYILITVAFDDTRTRAKYFGVVSGAAGLGAAAGPLIGGLITSTISWRASFLLQVLIVVVVIVLARHIVDPPRTSQPPAFDVGGAVLSAAGLIFIVLGILQSGKYGWTSAKEDFTIGGRVLISKGGISPVWILAGIGALFLLWFLHHVRARERAGADPLIASRLFRVRTSNLGLVTQLVQWLVMQGSFFVISVFLQESRGYDAIRTGLVLTPATIGILAASALAGRMAGRHPQRWIVIAGFLTTTVGMAALLAFVRVDSNVLTFVPGLLLMGIGVGSMLTASVNVVQSAFPDSDQGDISGLSRSVSNLGSSLGTALAGSILVGAGAAGNHPFALSAVALIAISLIGLTAAWLLPRSAGDPAKA